MIRPLSTGGLMNSARKPRRSRPAIRAAMPAVMRQPGRERGEALVPARDEVGDRGRRQGRAGRHRPHDEHPRAAQRGVQQQRAGRRVEAYDRRHARDARVRERLRNEDRPDREAGDQIDREATAARSRGARRRASRRRGRRTLDPAQESLGRGCHRVPLVSPWPSLFRPAGAKASKTAPRTPNLCLGAARLGQIRWTRCRARLLGRRRGVGAPLVVVSKPLGANNPCR